MFYHAYVTAMTPIKQLFQWGWVGVEIGIECEGGGYDTRQNALSVFQPIVVIR